LDVLSDAIRTVVNTRKRSKLKKNLLKYLNLRKKRSLDNFLNLRKRKS
jgi:hypothetical protein